MVVLAQQAGETMLLQVRVVVGSLISTSGTLRVMAVAAGAQAVTDLRMTGMACPSGVQMRRMERWALLTPLELSCL